MGKHDHCCVPGCTARRNDGLMRSFHEFPQKDAELERRLRWIIAIKRDEGPNFKIGETTVICSAHFLDEDYSGLVPPRTDEERESPKGVNYKYRLKQNAVPYFSEKEIQQHRSARPPPKKRVEPPLTPKKLKPLSAEQEQIVQLKEEMERLQSELSASRETEKKLIADIDGLKLRCCSYDALRKLSESESAAEKATAAAAKGEKYQCPFEFFYRPQALSL